MIKKTLLFIFLIIQTSFALTLDEVNNPMPLEGRLSNTDKVESNKNTKKNLKIEKAQLTNETTTSKDNIDENNTEIEATEINTAGANYADLSLKRLADDVALELDMDSNKINSDLSILWAATMERSETMKYTIYKLSNPDEDKPNESTIKKIIKPLANISSLAGASLSADPFVATGALIGGGLINAFTKDDKEVNYRFSKVSDADMVLLVRKIDDLQKKLLDLYIDYKTKQQLANMTEENLKKREDIYKSSQNKSKEELVISDVYYRTAKTNAQRAQDEYITSRAILENLVGLDALKQIEADEQN